uniref:Uncharacterized protein n=1 Tax=Peronospora matthiolae TaxID=2874970 RepID=A0AAV1URA6_9STRA
MQTLLDQLLVYLLSSGKVVAVAGVLINVMLLLFAGFNPPAAVIPDRYRWLFDITPQCCSLSILVSLVFGNCPEDLVYDEVTKGLPTCDRNSIVNLYELHRRMQTLISAGR